MDSYEAGLNIVHKLCDLEVKDGKVTTDTAAEIGRMFKGVRDKGGVFRYLDEKPGSYGYNIGGKEWHWKLRQARNNHPIFFDILSGRKS